MTIEELYQEVDRRADDRLHEIILHLLEQKEFQNKPICVKHDLLKKLYVNAKIKLSKLKGFGYLSKKPFFSIIERYKGEKCTCVLKYTFYEIQPYSVCKQCKEMYKIEVRCSDVIHKMYRQGIDVANEFDKLNGESDDRRESRSIEYRVNVFKPGIHNAGIVNQWSGPKPINRFY